MKRKLIINADDLGLTKGFNVAIKKAHLNGYLTHASLMVNTDFFEDALVDVLPQCPFLKIGLHLNLSSHKSLSLSTKKIAKNGVFNNSFLRLLFLRKSKKVMQEIEQEIELQIQQLLKKTLQFHILMGTTTLISYHLSIKLYGN